jgi:hypothetical protein
MVFITIKIKMVSISTNYTVNIDIYNILLTYITNYTLSYIIFTIIIIIEYCNIGESMVYYD